MWAAWFCLDFDCSDDLARRRQWIKKTQESSELEGVDTDERHHMTRLPCFSFLSKMTWRLHLTKYSTYWKHWPWTLESVSTFEDPPFYTIEGTLRPIFSAVNYASFRVILWNDCFLMWCWTLVSASVLSVLTVTSFRVPTNKTYVGGELTLVG